MVELTRKEYNIIAKKRGIIEPQKMSTQELWNTLSRYDSRRKVKSNQRKLLGIGLKNIAKIQNISKNELNKAKKLQNKSIDELKVIARLRRIKNIHKLTKEDLVLTLLKSESSTLERNYMKQFNNNTDDDDNDTYDGKIRGKISDINMILSRLGNTITNNDRKKIKKEIYEIEKKKIPSNRRKEKNYDHLVELVNTLNKKEEYKYDRDDLDYYGIRDIENLFDNNTDNDDFITNQH